MTQVQQFGGNTTVVSNGSTAWGWNDANNSGAVDKGDVVVRYSQGDASVFSYVVGYGEGLYTWGDPHIDNVAITDTQAFDASVGALMVDAKDGRINDGAVFANAQQALVTLGQRKNIGDFHADAVFRLGDGRTTIEHDVVRSGNVAFTDRSDWNVRGADGERLSITFGNVCTVTGNEGESPLTVSDTSGLAAGQALADTKGLPVIHEFKGANVIIDMVKYGEDVQTARYADIVRADGSVDTNQGKFCLDGIRMFDASRGSPERVLMLAFGLADDEDDEKAAKRLISGERPPVPAAAV